MSSNIEAWGTVVDVLRNDRFRIKLDDAPEAPLVEAYISGRIRKFMIRIVMGDRVQIEMSPYDLTKGRIMYRAS